MIRRLLFVALALSAMIALVRCSNEDAQEGTPAPPSANADIVVTIDNMAFSDSTVTIHAGDTVAWVWKDAPVPHNVDIDNGPKSPTQRQGTWEHTFTQPGTYHYKCDLHPMMTGTVIVE